MWCVWVCVAASSVAVRAVEEHIIPASHRLEEHYLSLAFDLEVVLEQHLRNWRFLTETPSNLDVGDVFNRRWLDPRSETQLLVRSRRVSQMTNLRHNNRSDGLPVNEDFMESGADYGDEGSTGLGRDDEDSGSAARGKGEDPGDDEGWDTRGQGIDPVDARITRVRRSGNIPVMYMPGKKTKRKCVAVNGIFSGYNAFSYLSFITGIISLVLNVNNNINNNNNNNNLNNNNAISNNNVDANANSNTANQIVVFPPGRKRRSVADLMLQLLANRSTGQDQAPTSTGQDQAPTSKGQDQAPTSTGQDQRVKRGVPGRPCRSFSEDVVVGVIAALRLLVAASTDGVAATLEAAGVSPGWRFSLCPAEQALAARGGSEAHIAASFRVASRRWTLRGFAGGGLGCRRRSRGRSWGAGCSFDVP